MSHLLGKEVAHNGLLEPELVSEVLVWAEAEVLVLALALAQELALELVV